MRRVQTGRIQRQNPAQTFANLDSLLVNRADRVRVIFVDPGIGLRHTQLGLFVQDDFRVNRRHTPNIGMRYENHTVMNDVARRLYSAVGDKLRG